MTDQTEKTESVLIRQPLTQIIEGLLLAANKPLTADLIRAVFDEAEQPSKDQIQTAIKTLTDDCADRGIELIQVASGWRYQVKKDYSRWVNRLWEEKPQRYTRALLETLALIVYRQPITRGEIEEIRGVTVSSNIIKTLQERDWVRVIGHREAPGRPAMYATTRQFMDYFNLKNLDELPPLMEVKGLDESSEQELAAQLKVSLDRKVNQADTESAQSESMQNIMPLALNEVQSGHEAHSSNVEALLKELDEMESGIKTNYDDYTDETSDGKAAAANQKGRSKSKKEALQEEADTN